MPYGQAKRSLLSAVKTFAPQAIWLDGLWAGAFARNVAIRLRLPYFYRSHNIEHRYMARQASLASAPVYRLRLALTLLGLEAFEQRVVMGAAHVFDISVDDLAFWQSRGLPSGQWLAPIVRVQVPPPSAEDESSQRYDVVFVGNLHTPNNIEGLRWLFQEVWPLVVAQRPAARALVAGSAPSDELRTLVAQTQGLELLADPADVWPLYRSARVLVNPARSGSGVNIKSVEMLQLDCPIVSTPTGVGGLPPSIQSQFMVADTPSAFASAVVSALAPTGGLFDKPSRALAREAFAPTAINDVIAVIKRLSSSTSNYPQTFDNAKCSCSPPRCRFVWFGQVPSAHGSRAHG
jgi:glycosyltransferase involved in cell wall biosynthesis